MNNITCDKCAHYRKVSLPSALMQKEIGNSVSAEPSVLQALNKISEQERQLEAEEAKDLLQKINAHSAEWQRQPRTKNYCGLEESNNIYLVHQTVFGTSRCNPKPQLKQSRNICRTCVHSSTPQGPNEDQALRAMASQKIGAASFIMRQGESIDINAVASAVDSASQLSESISRKQAADISWAFSQGGISNEQPKYLPYCRHFSKADEYIHCWMKNPHSACTAWHEATWSASQSMNAQINKPSSQRAPIPAQPHSPPLQTTKNTSTTSSNSTARHSQTNDSLDELVDVASKLLTKLLNKIIR